MEIGKQAEAAAAAALRAEGFTVTDLNDVAGNWPIVDLLARIGSKRWLIQVRGTTIDWGPFRTEPAKAHQLITLAEELGCHALYAFVHFTSDNTVIRFAPATEVAALAEEDEANTAGKNRYHVNINQFTLSAGAIEKPQT
ncbi:hypothetical protein ACFV9C_42715 [Kribbella sp. NPDC059898]|uniref:hypothetical protein n=1 Tax=Kribbella sp. NPDC059898 TaxID=3346995 RepID=UPI003650A682